LRGAFAIALAAVLLASAGCSWKGLSGGSDEAAPTAVQAAKPRLRDVLVTVVDGDTHRVVKGARVTIGRRSAHTTHRGLAGIPVLHRSALQVRVTKSGYLPRTVRLWFKQHPRSFVRIFQRKLQWPMYGATPARTQSQTTIKVRPPFRTVWSRGLGTLIEFPAVVSEGVAYIGNAKGTITALDMRDGKRIWTYDPPGGKMASSPAVVGREVVVHGMDGIVRVLDTRTGRMRWQVRIGSPVESSPVIRFGLDFFGAWNGRVYALDLKARRFRWTRSFGYKITSSAAVAGSRLFIGDYGGRVLALAPRSGRLLWRGSVNGRVYGTPAVHRGRVFVPSSTGGSLTAFTVSGRRLWSRGTGAYVYSSPAAWGGRVFLGSYNGVFYSLSAATGRTLWTVRLGGRISGAAIVVGGVAYAGARHSIVGVDARTGRVLLRFAHGDYVPVSGGGKRLLLHGFSRLWAVEARRS
jgi:outer membrane protein assembly factor BamB